MLFISYSIFQLLNFCSTILVFDKLLIIKMNLQKIKSAKNITYTDRYSKNPIINSLIKNKLETEMVQIKDSFANIIKKQQGEPQKTVGKSPLRRNKSYSINPKIIQQAVRYDPIERLNKATELFISNRQTDSFLVPQEELRKINRAREEHFGLNTKLSRSDAIAYQNQTNLKELSIRAYEATVRQYDQQTWLPKRPEIQYLLTNKKEQIQEQLGFTAKKYSEGMKEQLQKLTNRITGNAFLRSESSKKMGQFPLDSFQPNKQDLRPTNYIPQKYHKNDYKSIEGWLDKTIETIAKEQGSPEDKLNLVYSSYICVWKQLIRLTYIESDQKGLLLEKILYSMLRLFSGLISEQQSLSRSYLKQSETENNQIKKMMEHRMEELNKRHIQYVKQSEQLKSSNHKLSKILISFEKVNHELVEELEKMTNEKKKAERQFFGIGNSYFKTLELLYDKKLIEMDYTKQEQEGPTNKKSSSEYKTYLLLDKNSKPVVLGRFKYETNVPNPKPRYASDILQQSISEELRKYNDRYGHTVKELENVLTRFWEKKQDDLQMKGIINTLIKEIKIKDSCVGTTQTDLLDFSCQFPENSENYVEKLLKDQRDELNTKFSIEKMHYETQMQKKQAIFQRWKANAEEVQQKNKGLHENNLKLSENLKKSREGANELLKQIDVLAKNIEELKDQIEELKVELERSKTEEQSAKAKQKQAISQRESMKGQLEREKENNRMLVRANLEMKEKVQKFDIRYNTLLKSVKSASPWLEKFMMEVDKPTEDLDIGLLKTVSAKIQEHLSEYVTKDSSLFMTRLS